MLMEIQFSVHQQSFRLVRRHEVTVSVFHLSWSTLAG